MRLVLLIDDVGIDCRQCRVCIYSAAKPPFHSGWSPSINQFLTCNLCEQSRAPFPSLQYSWASISTSDAGMKPSRENGTGKTLVAGLLRLSGNPTNTTSAKIGWVAAENWECDEYGSRDGLLSLTTYM